MELCRQRRCLGRFVTGGDGEEEVHRLCLWRECFFR